MARKPTLVEKVAKANAKVDNRVKQAKKQNKKLKAEGKLMGRPSSITPFVLSKIREAAQLDASVEEMAFLSGVSRASIYNYFNRNPDFLEEIERLRAYPIITSRKAVVRAIEQDDTKVATWYLERKKRDEFAPTPKIEVNITHDDKRKEALQLLSEQGIIDITDIDQEETDESGEEKKDDSSPSLE